VFDHAIDAPVVVGLFSAATADLSVATKARTTVKGSERAWRVAPPTLAGVMAERSRSVPARLVLAEAPAVPVGKNGDTRRPATLIGAAELPLTAVAHAPTAVVRRSGAGLAAPLAQFNAALVAAASEVPNDQPQRPSAKIAQTTAQITAKTTSKASQRVAPLGMASRAPGAALTPGQCVVLKLPNAAADAGSGERPALAVADAPARVVLLDTAGQILADQIVGPRQAGDPEAALALPRGTACIVAIGQGLLQAPADQRSSSAPRRTGLWGWHAGLRMPYVGQGSAVGPGCVLRSTTDTLSAHRERAEAGWVSGAELARGVTTVSTRFAATVQTVVVIVDDPAVTGVDIGQRQLLLGLDGAVRATDAAGTEHAPVLLTMDNRSVLAYEVKPVVEADGRPRPVVVTVASQEGWSLVGVMAAPDLDPQAALNLIAARGLQAALQALAPRVLAAADGGVASVLRWHGPVRSTQERRAATARANGIVPPPALRALAGLPAPRALRAPSSPRPPRKKER
jgi:large repetitive protein